MADKKFIYRGPPSGATLVIGEGKAAKSREVLFFDGVVIELPAEHPYVKRLTAQRHLTEWAPPKTEPKNTTPPVVSETAGSGTGKGTK